MNEKVNNAENKTEQAKIMGVKIPKNDYWGDYSSKICGSVGGAASANSTKEDVDSSNQK